MSVSPLVVCLLPVFCPGVETPGCLKALPHRGSYEEKGPFPEAPLNRVFFLALLALGLKPIGANLYAHSCLMMHEDIVG
jgi:hypothetical protein